MLAERFAYGNRREESWHQNTSGLCRARDRPRSVEEADARRVVCEPAGLLASVLQAASSRIDRFFPPGATRRNIVNCTIHASRGG